MARHPLELRKIKFISKEYQQSLKLREQILRLPLGLKLSAQELARDIDDTHLGGFIGTELVACLVLSRVAPTRMKMRKVAVAENFQDPVSKEFVFLTKLNSSIFGSTVSEITIYNRVLICGERRIQSSIPLA